MSRRDPRKRPLTLPHGKGPKLKDLGGLSLVSSWYNNEELRMQLQYDRWASYSKELKNLLHIVIVDDGAKEPIVDLIDWKGARQPDFSIKSYRIQEDIKWNTPGALNLGVLQAPTDWVIWMDSDCYFEEQDLLSLLNDLSPLENMVYYFPRKRVYKDRVVDYRYHPCVTLCHKETFKMIGGFDEDFVGARSGGYGVFDKDFELRIVHYPGYSRGYIESVPCYEMMADVTGGTIQLTENINSSFFYKNVKVMYDKNDGRRPRNRSLLNFKWELAYDSALSRT